MASIQKIIFSRSKSCNFPCKFRASLPIVDTPTRCDVQYRHAYSRPALLRMFSSTSCLRFSTSESRR
jgi:hypothetical protein